MARAPDPDLADLPRCRRWTATLFGGRGNRWTEELNSLEAAQAEADRLDAEKRPVSGGRLAMVYGITPEGKSIPAPRRGPLPNGRTR